LSIHILWNIMMKRMDKKDYNDANWVKVDLHLHSVEWIVLVFYLVLIITQAHVWTKGDREINDLIQDKVFGLYPCNHVPEHCEEANFDK